MAHFTDPVSQDAALLPEPVPQLPFNASTDTLTSTQTPPNTIIRDMPISGALRYPKTAPLVAALT